MFVTRAGSVNYVLLTAYNVLTMVLVIHLLGYSTRLFFYVNIWWIRNLVVRCSYFCWICPHGSLVQYVTSYVPIIFYLFFLYVPKLDIHDYFLTIKWHEALNMPLLLYFIDWVLSCHHHYHMSASLVDVRDKFGRKKFFLKVVLQMFPNFGTDGVIFSSDGSNLLPLRLFVIFASLNFLPFPFSWPLTQCLASKISRWWLTALHQKSLVMKKTVRNHLWEGKLRDLNRKKWLGLLWRLIIFPIHNELLLSFL